MSHLALAVLLYLSTFTAAALAGPLLNDKYHATYAEKAACMGDATRLCSNAFPDEDKLILCMKAKQDALSAVCASAFAAGLKRRHL